MIYTVHVKIREYGCCNDEYHEIYTYDCIDDANDCISFLTDFVDHPIGHDDDSECRCFYPSKMIVCDDIDHVNQIFGRTMFIHDHNSVTFTP